MANAMLGRLEGLLKQKKNNGYYAQKLGISVDEVVELKEQLKNKKPVPGVINIDPSKYNIKSVWTKTKDTSVLATLKSETLDPEAFRKEFTDFLKTYKPRAPKVQSPKAQTKDKVCLIIPKQDAHFNKFDIKGENDIDERFNDVIHATLGILEQVQLSSFIEEVVYVVGSDQFNSEWTSCTTKGTPQQNILSYHQAFRAICDHEVVIIKSLLMRSGKVRVVFVPGNHDQYVGWHLVDWLETYFRSNSRVEFDSNPDNTKYHRYNNTAIMLNHGDDMRAPDLANKFPIGFKKQWSLCDHYYIFTGDKHHEKSYDFNGIRFFQVPQLSKARSGWDDKKGFEDKAEMVVFSITRQKGMSKIYKEIL
jgi:hypothetical protein